MRPDLLSRSRLVVLGRFKACFLHGPLFGVTLPNYWVMVRDLPSSFQLYQRSELIAQLYEWFRYRSQLYSGTYHSTEFAVTLSTLPPFFLLHDFMSLQFIELSRFIYRCLKHLYLSSWQVKPFLRPFTAVWDLWLLGLSWKCRGDVWFYLLSRMLNQWFL